MEENSTKAGKGNGDEGGMGSYVYEAAAGEGKKRR